MGPAEACFSFNPCGNKDSFTKAFALCKRAQFPCFLRQGRNHLLVRMQIIITGLEIATNTVANATKTSSLATKNSPLVAYLASSFLNKE